jgi:pyroglutamyl-peptidase
MKKILLTGFNAFHGIPINPSQVVVQEIGNRSRLNNGYELFFEILPTEFKKSGATIINLITEIKPDFIINVGVSKKEETITLERVALNLNDTTEPDNSGYCPKGISIIPNGQNAFFTNVPIIEILKKLKYKKIPVKISNHAGTFVCNHVYYLSFHQSLVLGINPLIGFVHIPLPKEYRAKNENSNSISYIEIVHSIIDIINLLGSKS